MKRATTIILASVAIAAVGWSIKVSRDCNLSTKALVERIENLERFDSFAEQKRVNLAYEGFLTEVALLQTDTKVLDSEFRLIKERFKKMAPHLQRLVMEKAEDGIQELARDYAGTEDEDFGRTTALWHANNMQEVGGITGTTPEKYVEGTFNAAKSAKAGRGRKDTP